MVMPIFGYHWFSPAAAVKLHTNAPLMSDGRHATEINRHSADNVPVSIPSRINFSVQLSKKACFPFRNSSSVTWMYSVTGALLPSGGDTAMGSISLVTGAAMPGCNPLAAADDASSSCSTRSLHCESGTGS